MGSPATYFFLTIEYGRLVVKFAGTGGGEKTKTIESKEVFADFFRSKANEAGVELDDLTIMCSSSLDFPEEETNDPEVLELVRWVR